jgi:hypothetical protein
VVFFLPEQQTNRTPKQPDRRGRAGECDPAGPKDFRGISRFSGYIRRAHFGRKAR